MKRGFMRAMRTLHKWLALVVGIQLVLWTVSGLVFALLDDEKVAAAGNLRSPTPRVLQRDARLLEPGMLPGVGSAGFVEATLQPLHDLWIYRLRFTDRVELRHAVDGAPFVVDEALVRELATARYAGSGALESVALREAPVLEARGAGAVWQAAFDDPERTHLYFSAEDGGFVAARNDRWRLFDVFWMLHTMDYRGRDDFNHPLVILFATGALWIAISGVFLLFQSFRPARPGG
jgi:Na+-transporting NADH:ubiquinone oxidoreductase subunit F